MHPTPLQKDTTFTKIFVGGLPYHTNDASLRKYFEAFGDIDEAVVITDRQTGKSRGYGFVSAHARAHTHTRKHGKQHTERRASFRFKLLRSLCCSNFHQIRTSLSTLP